MNIEQYRALKAQEKQGTQVEQTPTPQVQVEIQPTQKQEPEVKESEVKAPEKIVIDGQEVTLDELKKGYMRTSDYTKKTQEVAHQRKETEEAIKFYEHLKQNPQLVQQLKQTTQVPPNLDPATAEVVELRKMVFDMKLDQEINFLKSKYADFDVQKVLSIAREKQLPNLEDAYMLTRNTQPTDPEAIKQQLRQEILRELEAEKVATQTIITSNGSPAPLQDNTPRLTEQEQKVARMMFRGVQDPNAEYVKWRDASGRVKK